VYKTNEDVQKIDFQISQRLFGIRSS